jgi:hypothetical protein
MEWLVAPIDPTRLHLVDPAIAWHARLMVLAWGIFCPLGVLVARFFKVMPRQNWPAQCDNRFWWLSHLGLQYLGGVLMVIALAIIFVGHGARGLGSAHAWLGYSVLMLGAVQFLAGWLRGTKGGPSEPSPRGDHYDMSCRRVAFERLHKCAGYLAILLAVAAILTGLWQANAPRWMWIVLGSWWLGFALAFVLLQRQGRAIDTYQAIWGPSSDHPGNLRKPIGWGVRRIAVRKGAPNE